MPRNSRARTWNVQSLLDDQEPNGHRRDHRAGACLGRRNSAVPDQRNPRHQEPHCRWELSSGRCVVPGTSLLGIRTPRKTPWFSLSEDRPLPFFAGIWTNWRGVRGTKKDPIEGEHQLLASSLRRRNSFAQAARGIGMVALVPMLFHRERGVFCCLLTQLTPEPANSPSPSSAIPKGLLPMIAKEGVAGHRLGLSVIRRMVRTFGKLRPAFLMEAGRS
jgi:hypothetical protein